AGRVAPGLPSGDPGVCHRRPRDRTCPGHGGAAIACRGRGTVQFLRLWRQQHQPGVEAGMTGLPIVACGSFVQTATEPAVSLREPLLAACPSAPRRVNRLAELSLIGAHRAVNGHDLPADTDIMMTFSHGAVADSAVLVR